MIIDDILEMMDDLLDNAASVPFSVKKSIVDCDLMRDYINEIRLNLPQEIKQAKLIVRDRQQIINDANKEADNIIRRAEDRAKEIKSAADSYIDKVLLKAEEGLQASLADVRKTRQAVRTLPNQQK